MSTNGAFGFHKNGTDKIVYNHSDSYPEELGELMIGFAQNYSLTELNSFCDNIKVLPFNDHTFMHEEEKLEPEDLKYATQIVDRSNWMKNDKYCEWAYVINLDSNNIEIYSNIGKEVCSFVIEFNLNNISDDWIDKVYLTIKENLDLK